MALFSLLQQLDSDVFMSGGSYRYVVHPLQFRAMQMRDYKRRFVIRRSDIATFLLPPSYRWDRGLCKCSDFLVITPVITGVITCSFIPFRGGTPEGDASEVTVLFDELMVSSTLSREIVFPRCYTNNPSQIDILQTDSSHL